MPVSLRAERQMSEESPPHPSPPSARSTLLPRKSTAHPFESPQRSHPPPAQSPARRAPPPPPPRDPPGSSAAQSPARSSGQVFSTPDFFVLYFVVPWFERASRHYTDRENDQ